ncbi:MAG: alpha/beta fold hydrolase [Acidobacteriia bacterium]|nr:alpha/beta fold hydrolase [Terriglobia bacterium]
MGQDNPSGNFRTSDGCAISYSLCGSRDAGAKRLALIHSLALDRSIWDGVVHELGDRTAILTYDCRGHGKSERRAGSYTAELFARDLAELMDHVGWPSAAVAGCSMGGCVAQAFAGRYAARATALGLVDTTAWYGEDAPQQWRERAGVARTKGLTGMVAFQNTRWFGDGFRAEHPEIVKAMGDVFLANDLDCYAATCAMLGDADLRPYLPSMKIPVAVIVGEEDFATPVAMAEYLHDAIVGSTLTILKGARHLAPVESPEQIASQLLELLRRNGVATTTSS